MPEKEDDKRSDSEMEMELLLRKERLGVLLKPLKKKKSVRHPEMPTLLIRLLATAMTS